MKCCCCTCCLYRIRYKRESFNETLFIKGNKIIPWQLRKYCALLGECVPGVVHDGVVVIPYKKVLEVTHLLTNVTAGAVNKMPFDLRRLSAKIITFIT